MKLVNALSDEQRAVLAVIPATWTKIDAWLDDQQPRMPGVDVFHVAHTLYRVGHIDLERRASDRPTHMRRTPRE